MKCHGCGHEFPNVSARCPRCQRSTSRRGRTSTDSRLLEFPRRARIAPPPETRPMPAWRAELNEKVKAIRANRSASSALAQVAVEEMAAPPEPESSVIVRRDETRMAYGMDSVGQNGGARVDSGQPSSSMATTAKRSSNTIVEAALVRVKRASEAASRAALPKIEPARISVPIDRQATARALEPATEIEPTVEVTPAPLPEPIQPVVTKPLTSEPSVLEVKSVEMTVAPAPAKSTVTAPAISPAATSKVQPAVAQTAVRTVVPTIKVEPAVAQTAARTVVPTIKVEPAVAQTAARTVVPTIKVEPAVAQRAARTVVPTITPSVAPAVAHTATPTVVTTIAPPPTSVAIPEETIDVSSLPAIDDLEPLDYLEAEIRKVDKVLAAEFKRDESPTVVMHLVIGIVDLIAVAVSSSPFLAFIRIADGSFSLYQTRLASGCIVGMLAFFYLALTQGLCGKTFGMMLTNTRIVDVAEFKTPTTSQVLIRTVGYFIAAAPACIGLMWAASNRKHRGWHDFVSNTMVVRDF
jgi:uncharacterized RDD family membrane protein YckC